MKTRTAYEVLGVTPSATADEIRERFKQLALLHHPDKVVLTGSTRRERQHQAATATFSEVTEAYAVLKDERRRREYDERLKMLGRLCPRCGGRGKQKVSRGFRAGTASERKCDGCGGTGLNG